MQATYTDMFVHIPPEAKMNPETCELIHEHDSNASYMVHIWLHWRTLYPTSEAKAKVMLGSWSSDTRGAGAGDGAGMPGTAEGRAMPLEPCAPGASKKEGAT